MVFFLTLFLADFTNVSCQEYTTVSADSIRLNGISLEEPDQILSDLLSKKFNKNIYTPPTGDSDEYDRIHYHEDDKIKVKLYEKNSNLRVSSITIKTEKVMITIGSNKFKVGEGQGVLDGFETSYNSLTNDQKKRPSAESDFYLNLVRKKNKEHGLMTCFIKQNAIVEIVISFDPG
jgi:hypothetical protein